MHVPLLSMCSGNSRRGTRNTYSRDWYCDVQFSKYRICLIRHHGYYLFHRAILCGFYSRAATNREWRLFNSAFSVKSFVIVRALRKTRFWSKPFSLIGLSFSTKWYLHSTSNLFPRFLPMISYDDRPPYLKKCRTSPDSMRSCTYRVYSCHSSCSHAHVLLEYYPRLVIKSGDYFAQHVRRYGDNSKAATNREQRLIEQIWYTSIVASSEEQNHNTTSATLLDLN